MPITRSVWIDDDGTGTTGTVLNNAELQKIYTNVDAFGGVPWSEIPFSAAHYSASSGLWTVPAGGIIVVGHFPPQRISIVSFYVSHGTMTISASTTSLFITLPATIPPVVRPTYNPFHYYMTGAMSTGYVEVVAGTPNKLRLLRDAGGAPFPIMTNGFGFFAGQIMLVY